MVYVQAVNLTTDLVEPFGIWSGEDSIEISIDGVLRTYLGAGQLLQPEAIKATPGLAVRNYQVRLSAVSADVENLVKGFNTRFAPSEVHRVFFDPGSRALIGPPHPVYRGMIDTIEFPHARAGELPTCLMNLVSATRVLTRTLPTKKSPSKVVLLGKIFN